MIESGEKSVWYREPYVWLLIAIPASAVIAGFVTLALAIATNDGLVVDDYYWQGKHINRVLLRDRAAAKHGISADLSFDYVHGVVQARLRARESASLPARVSFALLHATRAGFDRTLELDRTAQGNYVTNLPVLAPGHWYLQLEAEDWRLLGSIHIPQETTTHIAAEANSE
jgi:uncharacterized protein